MKKQEKSKLKEIKAAAAIIKKGGVVIFPTDTVYGIGCAYNNEAAKNRIYRIKKTPKKQQFPILVLSASQAQNIANLPPIAQKLIKKYWPGQLTLIVKSKQGQKIGIRIPDSDIVKSLITEAKTPLIGTSANFHGASTPVSYKDLDENFVEKADFVLKGICRKKMESTVVDLTAATPKILRQGAVKLNDLLGRRLILKIDTTKTEETKVQLFSPKNQKLDELVEVQKKGSQVLLPMIAKILKKNKITVHDLTALEVSCGPGSFTGTRVGVAVANALAFALGLPLNGKKGKIAEVIYEKSKFD